MTVSLQPLYSLTSVSLQLRPKASPKPRRNIVTLSPQRSYIIATALPSQKKPLTLDMIRSRMKRISFQERNRWREKEDRRRKETDQSGRRTDRQTDRQTFSVCVPRERERNLLSLSLFSYPRYYCHKRKYILCRERGMTLS